MAKPLFLVGQAILPAAGFRAGFLDLDRAVQPPSRLERRLRPRLAAPQEMEGLPQAVSRIDTEKHKKTLLENTMLFQ
jgi:hypothetical protein